MEEKRITKRIMESHVIGKRPVGKPRTMWVSAVETDSRGFEIEKLEKGIPERHIWRPSLDIGLSRHRRRRKKWVCDLTILLLKTHTLTF
jgi:hypothetical protein